ncbi:MAG: hotdog fold thioesterase [Acidimicrobiales bacterium]
MEFIDPAIERLAIDVSRAQDDTAVASMTVGADMLNGHGVCHGGYLFLLADTTMDYATNASGDGTSFAVHAEIDFLLPAHEGDHLVATGTIRHRWGRSALLDAEIVNETAGRTIAHFRGRTRRAGRGSGS